MERNTRAGGEGLVRPAGTMTWRVVLYRGARDNQPKVRTWDAATLCRALVRFKVWTGEKVDAPAWSPIELREGASRRAKSNVASVTMLVLDCDAGDPVPTLEGLGDEFIRLGHTSWSHSTAKPKARLVFPFHPDKPCPVEEWEGVWAAAARWAAAGGVTVDAATKDPSRLYFGPYIPPDVVSKEEAESWVYGPEGAAGQLPDRPRRYLSWAWLVTEYPPDEDEEALDFYTPDPTTGRKTDSNEGHDRRRRAFGMGLVRSRADRLARSGKGGRNSSLYGAARLVAQLETAGAVHVGDALAALEAGARASGLSGQEIKRTMASGYSAGRNDPEYPVDREMGR